VKYIAKSAAKNINSLDSQTMVPTATKLGRFILCEVRGAAAVVIGGLFLIRAGKEIFSRPDSTHFW
jgi:hypothetical protein